MIIKRHWTTRVASILSLFAILIASTVAQPVGALDVCIPDEVGVPYLSGNPNWWDNTLPMPRYWPAVDDPRWRGSFVHTPVPAGAATAHVTFRTLRNSTDVYMAWIVSVDPLLDNNEELWLALSPSGAGYGANDTLLQIIPFSAANTSTGDPLPAPAGVNVLIRTGPGNTWAASPTVPKWLQSATTNVRVVRSTADPSWAVLMKIPLQAPPNGIDLATSFHFWFGVMVTHPATGMVEYDYPPGLDSNDILAGTSTAGWQTARRDLGPTAAGCIQGVTLASSDIGTVDSAGLCVPATTLSSNMKVDDGAKGPGTIVFCARPKNDGAAINPDDINATFRLANWGSTSRLTGTWDQVNTPNCSLSTSDPKRACNNAAIATGATGAITYQWDLTLAEACSYDVPNHPVNCVGQPAPTKDDHQCMLVELNGVPGVTFPISSVARNMDFVEASTFVRDAEISVPGPRDVFLYVHTNNMPPPRSLGFGQRQDAAGKAASIPSVDPTDEREPPFESPADTPPLEKSSYEELRDSKPTYQVHVFHDTGQLVNLRGNNYKLLKPQTSFGYFVDHAGQLNGWRHNLDGTQEIIAGKYYKVGVPASGKATVTTTIKAIDYNWWWIILAILILLLVVAVIIYFVWRKPSV